MYLDKLTAIVACMRKALATSKVTWISRQAFPYLNLNLINMKCCFHDGF